MHGQRSRSELKKRNKIFVLWPVGVATLCLGLVVPGIVSPLWGVVLGLVMVFQLWVAGSAGSAGQEVGGADGCHRRGAQASEMRSMP